MENKQKTNRKDDNTECVRVTETQTKLYRIERRWVDEVFVEATSKKQALEKAGWDEPCNVDNVELDELDVVETSSMEAQNERRK